ncbi:head GIN domain-containing protein [Spirosoma fluviale]|uniref:Auto-transporter adhesin, head GIN domain n=1 Tax=Spirosoma fluviale TaxID=1597977 RepID=A0A286FFS4_9BACT|nr:head GIN domain-containing protein [Spirosoma fluviale]SOD81644.1 Putative auto-transporter adhesin, head GIN domain [Spirosoma fluviale]
MKPMSSQLLNLSLLAIFLFSLTGCSLTREDVGPYQGDTQTYAFTGFDRVDMGSAFKITVQQGNTFAVTAEGDRRNLNDLDVYTRNGTLYAQYRNSRRREYQTAFTITMPTLRGVDFSGASRSTVSGFSNLESLDITLSGASESQITAPASLVTLILSGASVLRLTGQGSTLTSDLSGSSLLQAFGYPVDQAEVEASGASKANVNVGTSLVVNASGASTVRYQGSPAVRQQLSGASSVQKE